MSIGQRRRFEVLQRDKFRCRYCGVSADEGAILNVDHIHPRARGGTDDPSNLVTACFDCNSGKSDRVLGPIPKARKRGWYPAVAPVVERQWPVGSHCCTPLKIAAIGQALGADSYTQAYCRIRDMKVVDAILPPLRIPDKAWWDVVEADWTYVRAVMEALPSPRKETPHE